MKTRQTEGVSLENSQEINIHAFTMNDHPQGMPGIVLNQVHNAYIHGCRDMAFSKNFLTILGDQTHDIVVADHALKK